MRRSTTILVSLLVAIPVGLGAVLAVSAQNGDEAGPPNLTPASLTWSPAEPADGDAVTFTANVTNGGDNATGPFNVTFYVNGTQLGDNATVEDLAPGASLDVTSEAWNATNGTHTVRVVVDGADEVAESDEEDNEVAADVEVSEAPEPEEPARPDLEHAGLSWSPAEPIEDDEVTFTVTVRNNATANASAFNVSFLVDGVQVGSDRTVGGLDANETIDITSDTWTAEPGDHTIEVLIDAHDDVNETDEDDNTASDTVSVEAAFTDLVLVDITSTPASPAAGEATAFTATVRNDGNTGAGPFTVRFTVNGTQLGADKAVASLAPGASVELTSDAWTASNGTHSIGALADAADQVDEPDEDNNARDESLRVGPEPLPDLTVTAPESVPDDPEDGDAVRFRAEVTNEGGAASGPFQVTFYVDGTQLGADKAVASLAPGTSVTVQSDLWAAVEGAHTVRVVVDEADAVAEADEDDNEATAQITVRAEDEEVPDDDGDGDGADEATMCHHPPGNPNNAHTITVGEGARDAHLAHGDAEGPCEEHDHDDHEHASKGRGHAKGREARD